MTSFSRSLKAWNSPDFAKTLKDEVVNMDAQLLPLQQALSHGNYANGEDLDAVILNVSEDRDRIRVKAGIFYSSVIAGCNCADDPSPVDEYTEYCEVQFEINKSTAKTTVALVPES